MFWAAVCVPPTIMGPPKSVFWTWVWTLRVHLSDSHRASGPHCLFVVESPVRCTGISHDEWVPTWARNDSINLTLNQESLFRTRVTELRHNWNSNSKRAVETTNHFIMSKRGSNKNRAQGRHGNFTKSLRSTRFTLIK